MGGVKVDQPNAAQKRWRESVRELGCLMGAPGPVEIHHVVGRTAKHNKIAIGHWWILPVSNEGHRMVEALSKHEQKELFHTMCLAYFACYLSLPVPDDVMAAIMDWHR